MIDCFSCYLYKNIKFCKQLIWKVFYSSLAEHVLVVAKAANQSIEEPEIVAHEDENRKITEAEALKKLDEVKKIHRSQRKQLFEHDQLKMWSK